MTTRPRSHQTHAGTPEVAAEVGSGATVAVDEGGGVDAAEVVGEGAAEVVEVGVTDVVGVRVAEVEEVEGRWLVLDVGLSDEDDDDDDEDVWVDDGEGADVLDSRPPRDRVGLV